MRRVFLTAGVVCFLLAATNASAQSRITGTAADPSGALIPGVSVTATNTQTGVVTTVISNESGAYTFASLQPGSYKLIAELPGFQTQTYDNVTLGTSDQIRLNFTMTVATVAQSVEVSVDAQSLLTTTSSSIGEVLSERRVAELPMVRQDVLDLVRIMPGMRVDPFGDQFSAFTGLPTNTINTTRDGLSVTDTRNNVLSGTTTMNPELIGEVRVILSPVDAEFGRGNGQVQIQTRSGTNQFKGAAVWNVRNTALSANSWINNRNRDPLTGNWSPTPIDWRNTNQYTVSAGGPIKPNRTFIFALWDQNISRTRTIVTTPVLTDTARQGIFRYFDNWNSGDAQFLPPTFPVAPAAATYPVVDLLGNPLAPPRNPDGNPYTGSLRCFSVFGNVKLDGSPFTQSDCPGGTAMIAQPWDALRPRGDQTGYIQRLLAAMPRANYFYQGGTAIGGNTVDGLNVAAFRWTRSASGISGNGGQGGTNPESIGRKQLNLKIDHNLNERHRVGVGWTIQRDYNDENLPSWPGGFYGNSVRRPQVLTTNFTSTLSSSLVNEVRFGISYQFNEVNPPWLSADSNVREEAEAWLLQGGKNSSTGSVYPVAFTPGAGNFSFGNNIVNSGSTFSGSSSPLFNYADTLSYTRGKHGFRMGVDLRFTRSTGYSGNVVPTAAGGAGGNPSALANAIAGLPAQLAATRTNAANMLYLLSGSINTANTFYWVGSEEDAKQGVWQDYTTTQKRIREQVQNEWAVFFKDDWKVKPSLTVNLGVRYEIYGAPYLRGGYTAAVDGQGAGLLGVSRPDSGHLFGQWLAPGSVYLSGYGPNVTAANALQCSNTAASQNSLLPAPSCDPSKMTKLEYVGPGSDNPDKSVVRKDWGNVGPAIGFAWQLPWFGQGKTTLRAGFSMTYGLASRNANNLENVIGNVAGASSNAALVPSDFPQLTMNRALQLADLTTIQPLRPTSPAVPGGEIPIYNRNTTITAYDPTFKTPYVQNMTASLTRSVTNSLVVDLRYEGALGRRRADGNGLNVNLANVYYNQELFAALEMTRRGEDAPLFDQMLAGLNLNNGVAGYGAVGTTVNGVVQRGSAHMRRSATFTNDVAVANYQNIANTLNTLSTGLAGLQALPAGLTGVSGRVLRNGCDRIAAGLYNPAAAISATNIPTRCFPENWIVANPQLGNTANFLGNFGKSNFHSLQTQITLRETHGVSIQSTYILAKTLGIVPANWTDPLNRNADYAPPYQAVRHDLRTNGLFDLPIGPGRMLFPQSSGWVARVLENWQTGMIFNVSSGNPRTIIGAHMLYATGNQSLDSAQNRADIVSPLFDQEMRGKVMWNGPNNNSGLYYGDQFGFVQDPQCQITNRTDSMGFNLFANGSCTLQAVTMRQSDGSTPIVLQNPLPGHRGNMPFSLEAPGKWKFDMNLSKRIRLTESKSLQFRVDAQNVLNHPDVADPQPQTGQSINTGSIIFGQIPSKGGNGSGNLPRSFNLQLRLDF